jgi:dCTP deaminase
MILSNAGIQQAISEHQIEIDPVPTAERYTTSAVDLTLGKAELCKVWDRARFDVRGVKVELNLAVQEFPKTAGAYLVPARCEGDGSVVLPPFATEPVHLLAMTHERVSLNWDAQMAARVEGRSSFARLGLVVHLTAPTIHAGFRGAITLEIINFGPFYLKLVPGQTRICQLIFERLESIPIGEPATAFQDQTTPAGDPRRR